MLRFSKCRLTTKLWKGKVRRRDAQVVQADPVNAEEAQADIVVPAALVRQAGQALDRECLQWDLRREADERQAGLIFNLGSVLS